MIYDLHKRQKNGLMTTTPTLCSVFVFIVTFLVTISMAQAQTAIPIPKHTYAYMIGAKNGLAAAIVDQYNVGAA